MGNLVNQVSARYEPQIEQVKGQILAQTEIVAPLAEAVEQKQIQVNRALLLYQNATAKVKQLVGSMDPAQLQLKLAIDSTFRLTYNSLLSVETSRRREYDVLVKVLSDTSVAYNVENDKLLSLKSQLASLEADYKRAVDNALAQEGVMAETVLLTDPELQGIAADKEVALAEAEVSKDRNKKFMILGVVVVVLAVVSYIIVKKL